MSLRITTNAIIRNYSNNLNASLANFHDKRQKVLTERRFCKVSEDPASATQAFQLRREYLRTEDFIENTKTSQSHTNSVEGSLMEVSKICAQAKNYMHEAINGTVSDEQLKTYATSLREMQKTVVLSMNAQYGDKFIFGGASTKEAPFELTEDGLKYRGILVSSENPDDIEKLKELSNEHLYVDLGLGLTEDNGEISPSTAFDIALPGINILKHGKDGDICKNVVDLMGQIADYMEDPNREHDKLCNLVKEFDTRYDDLIDNETRLGTKSQFLETNESRLKQTLETLNEKIVSVEKVDLSEAITQYAYAQYSYNAALKVGNSILSNSLLDFLR